MKRNGNNIIFSDDVTVESGSNQGKSLREVLESQDKAIKELRSNVKWIYQYGGVGSGSGGGGGTSSSWSILARFGDRVIQDGGDAINLPEAGTYKLYIHINNPGGDTFAVTYSYTNNNVRETRSLRLSQENSWTAEREVPISGNSNLTITVLDGNAIEKSITVDYITNSYTFDCTFANNDGAQYAVLDNSLFISTIKANGLKIALKYYLATPSLGIVNYSYTNFSGDPGSGSIDSSTSSEGTILLDAFTDINSVTDNNADNYNFTIQFLVNGIKTEKSLSVNLIPEGLYLKVVPEEGIIYQADEHPESSYYTYYTGSHSFDLTPYCGSTNQGRSFPYEVKLDGEVQEVKINYLVERSATRCTLNITNTNNTKWHYIDFSITDQNTTAEKSYRYWIYTKELESDLNWYPINGSSATYKPVDMCAYRQGDTDQSTGGFVEYGTDKVITNIITMYANSDERIISVKDKPASANDCLVCVGIQYSSTNDDTNPILTIQDAAGTENNNITIYQNKIVRGNTSLGNIYLGKAETYGDSITSNYHLISIYRRFIKGGANQYSELCVYIDGVLELVAPNYIITQEIYGSVKLSPGNYYINLLEISYFTHSDPNAEKYTYMTDAGIVRYWYTYRQRIQKELDINTNLLNYIENGFSLTEDNHVKVTDGSINSIALSAGVPVLVLKYNEAGYNPNPGAGQTSIPRFLEWSDRVYGANSNDSSKLNIGIAWSKGNSEVQDIDVSSIAAGSGSIDAQFTLDIQGSTTRTYHAKNYTLGIQAVDSTAGYTPLFSPKFNLVDEKTYLPEKSFTLKADVVDSSHSNNTCMGAFVNDNTSKFTQATVGDTGNYTRYVKNCLTGFPILVFVQISNAGGVADQTECYYLGIYNCNLGRSSFFNLGYCATSNLPELKSSDNEFCVCAIQDTSYALKPNLTVSEISDNNVYWDFSEYGNSILFSVESNVDKQFMFDDTESGTDPSTTNQRIQRFVEHTARAGYYAFETIGKGFRSHGDGYRKKRTVPDAKKQYVKTVSDAGLPKYEVDENVEFKKATSSDLINYINGQEDGTAPYVDFPSLVEYYTVCMAFGLLDSVQKNLNIKTWNGGNTFYFAFYDMDTCLGIDNDGKDSTYFAFSDYWEDNSTKSEEGDYYEATPVTVWRDYFDRDEADGIVGYDIASSYAFAVAKYARSIDNKDNLLEDADLQSPQNLWATWRRGNGPLANADKFIDTYYAGYMNNVDELMFNFNYRHKYLLVNSDRTGFSNEVSRFKGRRISYVREWLNGRLHILDAYLNIIGNTSITISDGENYDSSNQYYEAYPNNNVTDTANNDIYVIRDIFGSDQSYADNLNFTVKAPDYAPLIMKMGDSLIFRYLLKKSTEQYKIETSGITGNNKWVFGGSSLWTYLDSINSFARSPFNLNTSRLTTLKGDSGKIVSWNINMPALQEVSLTSPNYQGELIFDASENDNYPNLNNIDISNSKIQLIIKGENVKTIDLSNVNTTRVYISDCKALGEVIFNNSAITNCEIYGLWADNIDLATTNNKIKNLTLDAQNRVNASLNIVDSAIETLTLTNFKTVTIGSCPKLKSITINKGKYTNITSLTESVTTNTSLSSVTVYVDDLETLNLNGSKLTTLKINGTKCENLKTLNLSYAMLEKVEYGDKEDIDSTLLDLSPMTGLTSVNLSSNSKVVKIRFANVPGKPIPINTRFASCTNLERVYGNLIIGCSACFQNLKKFSIHGPTSESWGGDSKTKNDGVVVRMPLEIVTGIDTATTTHTEIVNKFNAVINFSNSNTVNPIFSDTTKGWWKEGNSVTNIQFKRSVNILDNICENTSCTQFDIYYVLNALALSGMTVNQGGTRSFWTNNSGETRFVFSEGNQPNRYMFYGCTKISQISEMITCTSATLLASPDHDSSGNVICDNGLLSPLVNVGVSGGLSRLFNQSVYTSRFAFRRLSGNYKITAISYQGFAQIYDEMDSLSYDEVTSLTSRISLDDTVREGLGNMTGFFDNLPSLGGIDDSLAPSYLDFSTLTINSAVTYVIGAFNSTYGRGTIDLQNIFKKKGNLLRVANSFKVTSANTTYNTEDSEGKVEFPITSDMFNGFGNLAEIGYHYQANGMGGTTELSTTSWKNSDGSDPETTTGFNGNGLRKYINQENFPYDIFNPCKTVLTNCSGLFQNLVPKEGAYSDTFQFPGELFRGCKQLKDVASFLKNCEIEYTLTSGGFSDCPNLNNITQIFYHTIGGGDNYSKLKGQIPPKLFYHGKHPASITYYGTDNESDTSTPADEFVIGDNNVRTVYYARYNQNIQFAFQAFYGCGNIDAYSVGSHLEEIDTSALSNALNADSSNSNYEYINPSYIPFKYRISGNRWVARNEDSKKETAKVDISRIYDGNYNGSTEFKNLLENHEADVYCYEDFTADLRAASVSDAGKTSSTLNYFCPPDLLSYLKNISTVNIIGMFKWCGDGEESQGTKIRRWMNGRICPYLLAYISEIRNFSEFFYNCKGLSSLAEDQEENATYLIPKDFFSYSPNILTLCGTFLGTSFSTKPNLDSVFYPLRNNSLDIRGIFAGCRYVNETQAYTISRVFSSNKLSDISGAFCYKAVRPVLGTVGSIALVNTNTNVHENVRTNVNWNNNFPDTGILESRIRYVYYGYGGHVTENFINLTKNNNTTNSN